MATTIKLHEISGVCSDNGKEKYGSTTNTKEYVYSPGMLVLFLTEVLGTAMMMFLGCMGVCGLSIIDIPVVPHFAGMGFGLSVLIVIQAIAHVSGAHLNPQVTTAAAIIGNLKLILVPVYFAAEFIGALVGYGLLKLVIPTQYSGGLCDTMPHKDLTIVQAIIIEIAITCVLIIVCGAVWDPRNGDKLDSIPIRFGFIVAGISMVAGPLTGASMNTARSFAPALINGNWKYHWIYWLGPTIGALIGSVIYKYLLAVPKK